MKNTSPTSVLLNIGHGLDHLFLLIFATAVATIATEWGMSWQDLMPYTVGAFVLFGVGSLPAGRLGDLWGRRAMMIVFFVGIGAAGLLVAGARGPWSLAISLTVMGAFAAIYHPVGIPMIVQGSTNPGFTIGLNGLAGNLGIAGAALFTGFLVKIVGWRAAFAVPAVISMVCGVLFALLVPREEIAPAKRPKKQVDLPRGVMVRIFLVMTIAAISGSLIFNFTTNGNTRLITERLDGIVDDPATIGLLLGALHGRVPGPIGGRQAHRPLPAQAHLPADRGRPGAAVLARRLLERLDALCSRGAVHGVRLRRDPVHRRDDRAVRGRSHALPRDWHAPRGGVRLQRAGRVRAGAAGEGRRLHDAARADGDDLRPGHVVRILPAGRGPRSFDGSTERGGGRPFACSVDRYVCRSHLIIRPRCFHNRVMPRPAVSCLMMTPALVPN